MKRAEVLAETAAQDALVVCNLGYPARELYSLADGEHIYYMLGSMGMASSIAMGVSLAVVKRVYALDGDGSVLMNLGSLSTIANQGPENLGIIIIDNRVYGSTGNQPTFTDGKTDLVELALGAGVENAVRVRDIETFRKVLRKYANQKVVIVAETEAGNMDVPVIPLSPVEIKERFMNYTKQQEQR